MAVSGVVGLCFFTALISVISSQESTKREPDLYVTDIVYLDISIGGLMVKPNHRITIGLFREIVPKTVENFVALANNKYGFGYKKTHTPFHRVIEKFMIQGGDFQYRDGYGGYSAFKPFPSFFTNENMIIKHYGPGWVCMANAGPDTNGSQFVILTVPTPWSDGHYTCFGRVLDGFEVVKKIEYNPTHTDFHKNPDRPIKEVIIEDSGSLPLDKKFKVYRDWVCF